MAEDKWLEQAKEVYASLCEMMDGKQWKYHKNDEKLRVSMSVKGTHMPVEFIITADHSRSLFLLYSPLPFAVPQERKHEMAIAVCLINNLLVSGDFEYDMDEGKLHFHLANTFMDCQTSQLTLEYLVYNAYEVVDEYNIKLQKLADGRYSFEAFMDSFTEEGDDGDD